MVSSNPAAPAALREGVASADFDTDFDTDFEPLREAGFWHQQIVPISVAFRH
jgi:hypothetical protein